MGGDREEEKRRGGESRGSEVGGKRKGRNRIGGRVEWNREEDEDKK